MSVVAHIPGRWLVALGCSALIGCSGGKPGTGPSGTDGTDGTGTDDTEETDVPRTETECDDERDDDGDGDTDCDDDDCSAEEHCSWPVTVDFESLLQFDANSLAELAGYGDCEVHITSNLERDRAQSCEGCDRVFSGAFDYLRDNCPEDDAIARPTEGSYGFAFRSATRWEVFGEVDGQWGSLGVAEDDGSGSLRIIETNPVEVDGVEFGQLTSMFAFEP